MKLTLTKFFVCLAFVGGVLESSIGVALAQSDYPIAGVQPDERPENAPSITKVEKEAGWYQKALTGLEPPYPRSFQFLEDQGNWYTPFNQPGMTGPYDIRGWHSANRDSAPKQ